LILAKNSIVLVFRSITQHTSPGRHDIALSLRVDERVKNPDVGATHFLGDLKSGLKKTWKTTR